LEGTVAEVTLAPGSGGTLDQRQTTVEAKSGLSLYRQTVQSNDRESLVKSQFENLNPEQKNQLANQFVGAASRDGINKLAETPDGQHALREIYNNASEDQQAFMRQVHKAQGNTAVDYTGTQGMDSQNGAKNRQPSETRSYSCQVVSGPKYKRYDNGGGEDIRRPITEGFRKTYKLYSSAEFADDAKNGKKASCCVVRQYISWDAQYNATHGGPPHEGFPDSAKPNTFYEDRTKDGGDRYGHRKLPYKRANGYATNGVPDQQNGKAFSGYDSPEVRFDSQGSFTFYEAVHDQCNNGKVVAKSDPVTIDWSRPHK
jgi:hypothetical protein